MKRVLFRVESGPRRELGTGHLRRARTLAAALSGKALAAFCSNSDPAFGRVIESGYRRFVLDRGMPQRRFRAILDSYRPALVVFDRLQNPESELRAAREAGSRIVTFDDAGPAARRWSDLRVDAVITSPSSTLKGYRYLVLPPAGEARKIRKIGRRLFVFVGGYDPSGATERILKILSGSKKFMASFQGEIICVGAGAGSVRRPGAFGPKIRLSCYAQTPKFAALLAGSDAAILSGGLALFQALQFGTPAIVIAQYPHQEKTAANLKRRGAVLYAGRGRGLSAAALVPPLVRVLGDAALRSKLSRRGKRIIDGQGARRVSAAIVGLLKRVDAPALAR